MANKSGSDGLLFDGQFTRIYLFSTSNKVLINLLNGIFDEDFAEDEVSLTVSNNEFIEDTLDVIRGDMFFEISKINNQM